MIVYTLLHQRGQLGNDKLKITACRGIYTSFQAACAAAEGQLSRTKDAYEYYRETRAHDAASVYSGASDDDDDDDDENSDLSTDSDYFCIRASNKEGATEKVWVEDFPVRTDPEAALASSSAASSLVTSNNSGFQSKSARHTESEGLLSDPSRPGGITIYHVYHEHVDPDMDSTPEQTSLGTYLHFKDARQAARGGLMRGDMKEYDAYVEGRIDDGYSYAYSEKTIRRVRNDKIDDAKGDKDFCIYTWSDYGDTERIYVEEGKLRTTYSNESSASDADISKSGSKRKAAKATESQADDRAKRRKLPSEGNTCAKEEGEGDSDEDSEGNEEEEEDEEEEAE